MSLRMAELGKRIAFFGATDLGLQCCRALVELGLSVVGIFTLPPEFSISWSERPVTNAQHADFRPIASQYGSQLQVVTGSKDPSYARLLKAWRPDLIFVVGWYFLLPRSIRRMAPLGAVGIHASLLPRYRGGAPLVWAMINGEARAGVSLFYLGDGVDDGDIVGQKDFAINPSDDIGDVLRHATDASVSVVRQYAPRLISATAPRAPQDSELATIMPQRQPEDGEINWRAMTARQAYDWIRAQTHPYPGAFTSVKGKRVTVWRASSPSLSPRDMAPGAVDLSSSPGEVLVGCADGRTLAIEEVSVDGQAMTSGEFLARLQISTGTVFDETRHPVSPVGF
jgi:methionyl-tRNA formyltransferase